MTVKFSIFGIKEVEKLLKLKQKKVQQQTSNALNKSAIFMQGEVKLSIAGEKDEKKSVDTGRFLNSVGFVTSKNNAVVFSKIPYAKFLEFGTSKIEARKHFQNSASRNKHNVKKIFLQQIKK
ncbi:MAG: HK97-gp10 family putative phage morphogenesis protein [Promethearchaeota archaeon]